MICDLINAGFTAFEAECMVKVFIEEKSVREAAQELGRWPGNVSDAITRAKKRCPNINHLTIPIGRRKAAFRNRQPTPFSQLGKSGFDLAKLI